MSVADNLCGQARTLIASRLGLDFPEARQADLERGLVRACQASSVSAPAAYLAWLAALPDQSPEWKRLASHLTVGETYFFRDRALFEALERHVLPSLIEIRRAEALPRLRLWSAGCATGEEPYSLAILLDRVLPDWSDWALTILATDINPEALKKAREARYRAWSFRETPQWIRDRYFTRRGAESFELDPRIQRMVTFAPLNLADDGYPSVVTNTSVMDLVLCRNVIMYFTHEAQRRTAQRLGRALMAGGWLAVSPSEASTELFSPLAGVNFPDAMLYRRVPDAVASPVPISRTAPALPAPSAHLSCSGTPGGLDTRRSSSTSPPAADGGLRAHLERARGLADAGKLDAARELCAIALARDRLDLEAHLLLAAICQELGDIPAALETLRRAIYLAPDCGPAHFLLGSLLLRRGQRKRGRRCMETVVSLVSPLAHDEVVLGSDGLTAGRLVEAARAYLDAGA